MEHAPVEEAPSLEAATPEQIANGEWRTAELRQPFGRGVNLELSVPDIAAVSARLRGAGYPLVLDAHERTYRVGRQSLSVRQLLVADPDGYLIRPSQLLGTSLSRGL